MGAIGIKSGLVLAPGAVSYSTSFSATENPISESGRWTNGGVSTSYWHNARTTSGLAYGAATSPDYDDCIAILSGFSANQSAQATVYRDLTYTAPIDGNYSHEIELHLRSQAGSTTWRGYEIDFWFAGSTVQIFRWNGGQGSVDPITITGGAGLSSLVTGDVVKATIVGSTINVYKNGTLIATGVDTTYTDGNPGMGFFIRPGTGADPTKYCISQFTASNI